MHPPSQLDAPPQMANQAPVKRLALASPSPTPSSRKLFRRTLFRWILFLSVVLIAAMSVPMFRGEVYTADDLGAFHLPMRSFYAHCLAAGNPFDWSPQMFCGFYLTGEGQIGGYHPLHLLLYRFLPLGLAFDLECLISYPLLLLGMSWFLRRWRLPREAAIFGGLAFTFCGFTMLHFVHVNAIAVVAHLPWLLLAIDVALRIRPGETANRKLLAGAAIALLTASQLLLGYPQYVWLSLLVEAGYALLIGVGNRRAIAPPANAERLTGDSPLAPRPSSLILWTALGFVIAAVQLLPTVDALRGSSRQMVDASFHNWGSLYPLNLVQLVAPYLFTTRVFGQNTHELGCYAGAVTLLLATWCVFGQRHSRRMRPLVWGAVALAIVGLELSLGEFGIFAKITAWLPVVNRFRFPCRAIVLVHFALAVLGAIGLAGLGRSTTIRSENRRGLAHFAVPWEQNVPVPLSSDGFWICSKPKLAGLWAMCSLFALSVVFAIGGPIWWTPDYGPKSFVQWPHVAELPLVWIGPVLIGSALLLIAWSARGIRWARFALVLLAAVDLGTYGMTYAIYPRTHVVTGHLAWDDAPSCPPTQRIAVDLAEPNQPYLHRGDRLLLSGWIFADGYAGLEPARQLDYCTPAALRAAGVGWAINVDALATRLGRVPNSASWIPVNDSLPRAKLFARVEVTADPARDISRIPLESAALVEQPIRLDAGESGTATIFDDRPGSIRLRTDAPARRLLFVSESFHSGWKAWIDGQPAAVLRVNGDFLGCICPAGESDVRFEFQPDSLRYGRLLSGGGLGLLVGLVLLFGLRRRHTEQHTS